jgi:hypothetical protein
MQAKTVAPMVRRFDLEIKRQVKYPDVVRLSTFAKPSVSGENKTNTGVFTFADYCCISTGKD